MNYTINLCLLLAVIGSGNAIFQWDYDLNYDGSFISPCVYLQTCLLRYGAQDLLNNDTMSSDILLNKYYEALQYYCWEDPEAPDVHYSYRRHPGYAHEKSAVLCNPEETNYCPALMFVGGERVPPTSHASCVPAACDEECVWFLKVVTQFLLCCVKEVYGQAWAFRHLTGVTPEAPCGTPDILRTKCIRSQSCSEKSGYICYKECVDF